MAKPSRRSRIAAAFREIGWARFAVCAIAGLAGGWCAFALALSGVTRSANPQLALAFVPGESTALANHADQMFFAEGATTSSEAVRTLALSALRQQAINPKALRIIGYAADAGGEPARAERHIRMAARLSRREAGAQLWLIENSVRRNDARQTLIHYDIALRAAPETHAILFPRLLAAIDDRGIRSALNPYLAADNGWSKPFMIFASANSTNLSALVDLVLETGGSLTGGASHDQLLVMLERLVGEGKYADARRLYLRIGKAQPDWLTSLAFNNAGYGAIDWKFADDPDAGASLYRENGNGATMLALYANAATTRTVATKILYLPPGRYAFAARLASIERGRLGFLRWQMRCLSDSAREPFWRLDSVSAAPRAGISVSPGCAVQMFELIASGGTGRTGLEAKVGKVAIRHLP